MAVEPIFTTDKDCPICKKTFAATMARSRLTMIKQDSDYCTYYKEVNPNFYAIWVCPHCGYAAMDTYFAEQTAAAVEKIRAFLTGREVNVNFSGRRTREQAIATYKLAIFYAELSSAQNSRLGALYLRLAWLYREGEEQEQEQLALDKARTYYEQALLKERLPIGNMSQMALEYLIGELLRRTGKVDMALTYLGKVVGNPLAKLENRVLQQAKAAWHQARDTKKQLAATAKESGQEAQQASAN
ncbi:DUF2225 domain-containing protein [Anaerospora hongkongensis]|uniref:DUF2225 domain-containing protein n=2 Tax=Anaerospora hongkongensis TaxID=244830 RepID=UPI0028A24855|nr:DUF2225 domain-containing protein [Anaerospora hongkongensis]